MAEKKLNNKVMTKEEWIEKAKELFGEDVMDWKFVCPSCGNIQSVGDFKQYKDKGAKAESAYFNCIGRYDGHGDVPMLSGKSPCNYSGGGLIGLNPITVTDGDKKTHVFAFAE